MRETLDVAGVGLPRSTARNAAPTPPPTTPRASNASLPNAGGNGVFRSVVCTPCSRYEAVQAVTEPGAVTEATASVSDARAPDAGDRIYERGPASSRRSCCAAGAARCQPRRWWRAKSLVRPPTHAASPCRSSSPARPPSVPVGDLQGWPARRHRGNREVGLAADREGPAGETGRVRLQRADRRQRRRHRSRSRCAGRKPR
jgi:hypothetical protein